MMVLADLPVTQINLQHCKEASSLLANLLSKLHTGVALVQEPWVYKKQVRGLNIRNGRTYYDTNCDIPRACIFVLGAVQARVLKQYTSKDVVAVQVQLQIKGDNCTVIFGSVYLPYDAKDLPPSQELVSLIKFSNDQKLPLIIGCDANAHHICSGSSNINDRGGALLEYLVTTDMDILNKGTKPTFVVSRRQEVIDISLASGDVAPYIVGWRVSDEESLSDHRYIQFQVKSEPIELSPWRNPRSTQWDAYYADLEKNLAGRLCTIETTDDRENEITLLQSSMESSYKNNCKKRKHLPRKGAPWWYPELAKMRKQCRHNVRRAHRHQIDWDTVKTGRREYKKVTRRCKRES